MNSRMKFSIYFLVCLLWAQLASAQQEIVFNNGLVAGQCTVYGREAIYKDLLAYQLIMGKLQKPEEGKVLGINFSGDEVTWDTITANKEGKFKGRSMVNGYLYLTCNAPKTETMLLKVNGHSMVYVNGVPRGGDIYSYGYLELPVQLKRGLNEFLVQCSRFAAWNGVSASLVKPEKSISFMATDMTLPSLIVGGSGKMWGGIRVLNTTNSSLSEYEIKAEINGNAVATIIPEVTKMTWRKVGFQFDPGVVNTEGKVTVHLTLLKGHKTMDETDIELEAMTPDKQYKRTFISQIDGSVQYFAVTPQSKKNDENPALFLSVHGAGVEAIGQARAYKSKDWGVLIAATNRRPRGFNWEDWGRMDALEVLNIGKQMFHPDPQHIYLTGHSMGGHGTWFLGATYPDKFAAIAPCSGYPTLAAYGSHDGRIPEEDSLKGMEKLLVRASNGSNTIALAKNYKASGVYILHGDADRVVPVKYARQMRELLGTFQPDFSYYEYPGGSHWWSNESVDWPPIFEYFKWHKIPEENTVKEIDFTTANPDVSAEMYWARIEQQEMPLDYSHILLEQDFEKGTINGTTENVKSLSFDVSFYPTNDTLTITLDSQSIGDFIIKNPAQRICLEKKDNLWESGVAPGAEEKNINRGGPFKEAFQHNMVFVYGTRGTREENEWAYNKARYDAETWYYRGNGAVDIEADKNFGALKYPDRGVILYGNADTNQAWEQVMDDGPISAHEGILQAGTQQFKGGNYGFYFVRPRKDSKIACVAVIGGTGLAGMESASANSYFSGGSGFPDFMIFDPEMLIEGQDGVRMAGFFDNDWTLKRKNYITQ